MRAEASGGAPVATVLASAVVVSLNVGKLPPALPLLREDFDLGLVEASLLVSFFQVAGMLLGLFGGMLVDRFGPRRVMRIGLAIAAGGCALGAASGSASLLLASRAVESLGFMLTVLGGPALLARSRPVGSLRATMALWSAYLPTGMAIGLAVTPFVQASVGWRPVWWAIAVLSAAMCALLGCGVGRDPAGRATRGALSLVRDTLRAPRAWLLAAGFGCYAAQWVGVFSFLPTLYAEGGVSLQAAGLLTAFGVAVNLVGNLGSGLLLQRGASRASLVAGATLAMVAGAWLCFGSDAPFAVRYAGVLLFSAVGGLIPGALFASTAGFAPHPRAVGTTTGLMQQGSTIGQFAAPPLVAAAAAAGGGWQHTWLVTGAFALGCLATAAAMARIDRRDRSGRGSGCGTTAGRDGRDARDRGDVRQGRDGSDDRG